MRVRHHAQIHLRANHLSTGELGGDPGLAEGRNGSKTVQLDVHAFESGAYDHNL